MIKIEIKTDGIKILDKIQTKDTTLAENAIVLRRLEEIKHYLLNIKYDTDLEVNA